MNIPSRASRHQAMRLSRASFDSAADAFAACGSGAAGEGGGVAVSVVTMAIAPASASSSARFITDPLLRPYLASVENRNTVVVSYLAPGFNSVVGNFGWFGESGKCCV